MSPIYPHGKSSGGPDEPSSYPPPVGLRQLTSSGDESFVIAVRIALDANGIKHLEQQSPLGGALPTSVLVREADYYRAAAVLRDVQSAPTEAPRQNGRVFRLMVALLGIGVVLMIVLSFIAGIRG